MGNQIGENSAACLWNSKSNLSCKVPTGGWEFSDSRPQNPVWRQTPLQVTTSPPNLCTTVVLSATGRVAQQYPRSLGNFSTTRVWSAGRQVFRNDQSGQVLCVVPNTSYWSVRDTTTSPPHLIIGAALSFNPADKLDIEENGVKRNQDILVRCNVNSILNKSIFD